MDITLVAETWTSTSSISQEPMVISNWGLLHLVVILEEVVLNYTNNRHHGEANLLYPVMNTWFLIIQLAREFIYNPIMINGYISSSNNRQTAM